jgi:hypothetical protein
VTSLDWRVDYLLSSSYLTHADTNNIRLQLHVQTPQSNADAAMLAAPKPEQLVSFSLTPAQFTLLYNDLKQAKQIFQHV